MTGEHLDTGLIAAFVRGELGDHAAAHVARHIDVCAACAARVAGADPLTAALSALPDPEPPADLVASVLAAARPEPRGFDLVALVAGLLLVALGALALALRAEPTTFAAQLAAAVRALGIAGAHLRTQPILLGGFGAAALAAAVTTLGALRRERVA